jgi:alkylation response protein AidB-like acyl-CoA dehydrogenase
VVARDDVFVVDAKAGDLRIAPIEGTDLGRKLCTVEFNNTPADRLGDAAALFRALHIATAALVGEMMGGTQRSLDITVEYAKMRKQFGKKMRPTHPPPSQSPKYMRAMPAAP